MSTLKQPENIKVILRIRPPLDTERESRRSNYLKIENNIIHISTKTETKDFSFDYIATEESTQSEGFENSAKEICESVLEGYNGTIFVYGQTNSGKTYTLLGKKFSNPSQTYTPGLSNSNSNSISHISSLNPNQHQDEGIDLNGSSSTNCLNNTQLYIKDESRLGILPRAITYLFLQSNMMEQCTVALSCSFIEIYMEQVSDLLNPNTSSKSLNIQCVNDKVSVEGLTKLTISSIDEAYSIIQNGEKFRHIAPTGMNSESSRSHAVFSIYLDIKNKGNNHVKHSVFHLIDLAGSERQKGTYATGRRGKEGGMINKSLMQLSFVIKTLSENNHNSNKHIPYRDSKGTLLGMDSIGGNAKTCVIANITPNHDNLAETVSTLNFAQRAKLIKNKAVVNEDANPELTARYYQHEGLKLKEKYNVIKKENGYGINIIDKKNRLNSVKQGIIGSAGKTLNVNVNVNVNASGDKHGNGNNNGTNGNNVGSSDNIVNTLDSVETEIEKMMNVIKAKDLMILDLERESGKITDKLKKFEIDIALKQKEINATEQRISNGKNQFTEFKELVTEYSAQNINLEKEITNEQSTGYLAECKGNEKEIYAKQMGEITYSLLDNRNTKIEELSNDKNALGNEIEKTETQIDTYRQMTGSNKAKIKSGEQEIGAHEGALDRLRKELDGKEKQFEEIQNAAEDIEIKIVKIKNNCEVTLNKLEAAIDSKNNAMRGYEKEIAEYKAQCNGVDAKVKAKYQERLKGDEEFLTFNQEQKEIMLKIEQNEKEFQEYFQDVKLREATGSSGLKEIQILDGSIGLSGGSGSGGGTAGVVVGSAGVVTGSCADVQSNSNTPNKNNKRPGSLSAITAKKIAVGNQNKQDNLKLKEEGHALQKAYDNIQRQISSIAFKPSSSSKIDVSTLSNIIKDQNDKLAQNKEFMGNVISTISRLIPGEALEESSAGNPEGFSNDFKYYGETLIEYNEKGKRLIDAKDEQIKKNDELFLSLKRELIGIGNNDVDASVISRSSLDPREIRKSCNYSPVVKTKAHAKISNSCFGNKRKYGEFLPLEDYYLEENGNNSYVRRYFDKEVADVGYGKRNMTGYKERSMNWDKDIAAGGFEEK